MIYFFYNITITGIFFQKGESFLKPSQSKHGQSAKIFKPYSLNLPKTYITRRGQMVLFTAPEDMIIGKSCHVSAIKSHIIYWKFFLTGT